MRARSALRRSFRPRVEALEGRALPSVCLVDRLTDAGEGKEIIGDLRYCMERSTSGEDVILFLATGTIELSRPLPDMNTSVFLIGPGSASLTVRRDLSAPNFGIFRVGRDAWVILAGLTIANGRAAQGGGVFNEGWVFLGDAVLTENSAGALLNRGTAFVSYSALTGNLAGDGGAIGNDGTLTMDHSTVSRNTATFNGGAIFNDGTMVIRESTLAQNTAILAGGIFNRGTLTISNSTLSGNSARDFAGAIMSYRTVALSHSTVAGNSAGIGYGGIDHEGLAFQIRNSIIATNTARIGPDIRGFVNSLGHNLIGNTDYGGGFDETDLLNVNPRLGPLQDNGGFTRTHALLAESPAINAGDNSNAPEWDQRGAGFPRIVGGRIDIGAFEVQAAAFGGGDSLPPLDPDVAVLLAGHSSQPGFAASWQGLAQVVTGESVRHQSGQTVVDPSPDRYETAVAEDSRPLRLQSSPGSAGRAFLRTIHLLPDKLAPVPSE